MKILLTGFEAFGSVEENPTQVIVQQMATKHHLPDRVQLVCEVIPVEYDLCGQRIRELIAQHQPDAVMMTGVAASRDAINLERYARNCDRATIPDNGGTYRQDDPIDPSRQISATYPSTLPLDYFYYELKQHEIPVTFSDSAGGYICNHTFYHAMWHVRQAVDLSIPVGFIHVPTFEVIPREQMQRAFELMLCAVASSDIEQKKYHHPLLMETLNRVVNVIPHVPDWCVIFDERGVMRTSVGHISEREKDALSAHVMSLWVLVDRVSDELTQQTNASICLGASDDMMLLWRVQERFIVCMRWTGEDAMARANRVMARMSDVIAPLVDLLK